MGERPWLERAARRQPLVLCLPLLMLLAWQVGVGQAPLWQRSWMSASTHLATVAVVVAPAAAAAAAWVEQRRHRGTFGLILSVSVRPPVRGALVQAGVAVALAGAVVLVAGVGVTTNVEVAGRPRVDVVMVLLLTVAVHSLLGSAVGAVWSRPWAAPVAAVLSYLWLVFLVTVPESDVEALSVFNDACCAVGTELDTGLLASQAGWLVGVGLVFAGIAAVRWRGAREVSMAAVVLVTGGLVVGAVAAPAAVANWDGLEAARAPDPRCRDGQVVVVCAWPEQEELLPAAVDALDRLIAAVDPRTRAAAGLPLRFSEPNLGEESAVVVLAGGGRSVDVAAADLVGALLPDHPSCATRADGTIAYPALWIRPYLETWLLERAGFTAVAASRLPPQDRAVMGLIVDAPEDRQLAWFEANLAAISGCSSAPVPV
jgi:hypothetical protein